MIGVNIGVPAPVAWFPFAGWKDSMVGDLHANGHDAIEFYTPQEGPDDALVAQGAMGRVWVPKIRPNHSSRSQQYSAEHCCGPADDAQTSSASSPGSADDVGDALHQRPDPGEDERVTASR